MEITLHCYVAAHASGAESVKVDGASSGINTGHHQCKAPQGTDPTHPSVPFDYDLGPGWYVVAAIVSIAWVYLLVGTLLVPERGQVRQP